MTGPMARPSKPSVRLTALDVPTMTRAAKRTYPQPRSGVIFLKNGTVTWVSKSGRRQTSIPARLAQIS